MEEQEQVPKLKQTKQNIRTIRLYNETIKSFLDEVKSNISLPNEAIYASSIAATEKLNIN